MAKEQDQTQDNQDQVIDTTEDDNATATAVKTSEDFDSKLDAEGIDENLPEDDKAKEDESEDKDTDSDADDTGKAEDKDTGDAETDTEDEETGDDDALSQNLVDQAIDLGLKTEEIALHKDDAELERTVEILSNIKIAQPKPDDKTQKPAKDDDAKDEGIKFENEEDIDPSILKAVRSLEGSNKELRQMVERLTGTIQQRNQDEFEDRFDGMIKDLGTDYEDVFGAGKGTDLNTRSAAHRNRKTMIKRMYAIASGYETAKERIPTEKELFDQALFALHRKKMNTVRSKVISEKGKKQKGRKAGVPASSKTEKPPTGVQKAIATSREFDKLIDTSE
jgi:hypothetical protein